MTVGELLERIDSRELSEWMAFERLEGPIGPWRADFHAGMVSSVLANIYRNRKKKKKAFVPSDFIPDWGAPAKEEQSMEEQQNIFRQMAQFFKAKRG